MITTAVPGGDNTGCDGSWCAGGVVAVVAMTVVGRR